MTQAWRLNLAAFAWGFAEATLFFIVPDVILSYIGLKHGPRAAIVASVIAALGAALGGTVMYIWSAHNPAAAHAAVNAVPAIGDIMFARAETDMRTNWFIAMLSGPLTSTPFKVFAVIAPHVGAALPLFMQASIIARLPRFLIVSVGIAWIGRWLSPQLGAHWLTAILAIAWLAFYAVFFIGMPN